MNQIRSTENARLQNQGSEYLNLKKLRKLPFSYCTAGQNPISMTDKEYLKAFARGPCSPTFVIPGLLSTKMVVEIDCEELRDHNPEVFKACGFTHCKKKFWEVKIHDFLLFYFGFGVYFKFFLIYLSIFKKIEN